MSEALKEQLKRKALGMASAQHCCATSTVYGQALIHIMELEIAYSALRLANDKLTLDLMLARARKEEP